MSTYGYIRVSKAAEDQKNIETWRTMLERHGVHRRMIFEDIASGNRKLLDRTGWRELYSMLEPGDHIVVPYLDRLSRNTLEGLSAIEDLLTNKEVSFTAIGDALTMEGKGRMDAAGQLKLEMFMALANYQRQTTSERIKEGMTRAKNQGKNVGRQWCLTADQLEQANLMRWEQGWSIRRIADFFTQSGTKVSSATILKCTTQTERVNASSAEG